MPRKTDILKRVADEARAKNDPAEKATALRDVYLRMPKGSEKIELAEEIIALNPEEHIAKTIRRDLAYHEVEKIDALTGKKREAQIEKAIEAVDALPGKQRTDLLLSIADKVE